MLNEVSLMGRLAAEPTIQTIRKNEKEITIARYRLAVERDYKKEEVRPVDFIMCKAFGADALFAGKYFHKGDTVVVSGRMISEPYKKEGTGQAGFFTGVQVQKSYLARKKREDVPDIPAMKPIQNGGIFTDEQYISDLPPLPEEDFPDLPPLPEEDIYLPVHTDMEAPFGQRR